MYVYVNIKKEKKLMEKYPKAQSHVHMFISTTTLIATTSNSTRDMNVSRTKQEGYMFL